MELYIAATQKGARSISVGKRDAEKVNPMPRFAIVRHDHGRGAASNPIDFYIISNLPEIAGQPRVAGRTGGHHFQPAPVVNVGNVTDRLSAPHCSFHPKSGLRACRG